MLDADIALYAMRGRANVRERMMVVRPGEICMSALVHSQLVQGAPERGRQDDLELLLTGMRVRDYDLAASERYGALIAQLGFHRVNAMDRMIAAHAISLDAVLVTNNTRDFTGVPGLGTENWAEPVS